MKVELGKEYRTKRDKYRVKLLTDEMGEGHPFLGIVYGSVCKMIHRFTLEGESDRGSEYDLVEVKPPVVIDRFCNAWRQPNGYFAITDYPDAKMAREMAFPQTPDTTFRLKLTIEEGRLDYPLVEATIGGAE